ncbi:polyadenylate-binding protein 2 [Nannochloropsis gaditana]|uniref:Polyadenylate-binding protein 2 n=1 Tax=Nannochloropsis gaditana TaxID=72520 RepID=W7UCN7_9STRA|nr:polyadenylate-binding protein 2 [Nannochloropsis gaditana]
MSAEAQLAAGVEEQGGGEEEEEYYEEEEDPGMDGAVPGEDEQREGDNEGQDDGTGAATHDDPEHLAAELQRQQEKIRQEEEKLKEMMKDVEASSAGAVGAAGGVEEGANGEANAAGQAAIDENSIYVGQVDYEVTPEELQAHFQDCGTINRVTILCDKHTGRPKGFAYVEFLEKASVDGALKLDNSLLKGRPIKVTHKRHNVHGFFRGRGGGRGRARGGFRGGYGGGYGYHRPRGRGRGRGRYHPYY